MFIANYSYFSLFKSIIFLFCFFLYMRIQQMLISPNLKKHFYMQFPRYSFCVQFTYPFSNGMPLSTISVQYQVGITCNGMHPICVCVGGCVCECICDLCLHVFVCGYKQGGRKHQAVYYTIPKVSILTCLIRWLNNFGDFY